MSRRRRPPVPPAGTRTRIGPDAIRAAADAHMTHHHGGRVGHGCRVCVRYALALTTARATHPATDPQP